MTSDLLAPLEPTPEDAARPSGTLRGDVAALDAAARNVEIWGGPTIGWRRFGAPRGVTSTILLLVHEGRASAGRSWDLGEVKFPKPPREDSAA